VVCSRIPCPLPASDCSTRRTSFGVSSAPHAVEGGGRLRWQGTVLHPRGGALSRKAGRPASRRRRSPPTSDDLRAVAERPTPRCLPPKSGTSARDKNVFTSSEITIARQPLFGNAPFVASPTTRMIAMSRRQKTSVERLPMPLASAHAPPLQSSLLRTLDHPFRSLPLWPARVHRVGEADVAAEEVSRPTSKRLLVRLCGVRLALPLLLVRSHGRPALFKRQ